jgi:hypothetical protein
MGVGLPPSCGVFLPLQLLQAFLLLIARRVLLLLPASVFVYSSCGRWVFPSSPVEFSSLHQSHKLSRSWLLSARPCSHPLRPGLACLFTVLEGIPLSLLWHSGRPTLFTSVFIVLIAYYSVSLFSLGGGCSVQGAMLIWPSVVCGSTAYHLAHLVVRVFPSCLGTGIWWWPGGPPGFSV